MPAADGTRLDPFRGYNFKVLITGVTLAFRKVSGLEVGVDITEYREGTDNNTVRKLPGLAKFPNLVFERGITDNIDFVNWMKEIVDLNNETALLDNEFRRGGTIQVLSRTRKIVREYSFVNALPMALKLADLEATSSDVLIETMELAHEGLTIITDTSAFAATTG